MATVLIVILSFAAYLIAYQTYGRYLSSKVFRVDPERVTPACELEDGIDFVPSRRSLVFGHHFTSIAGTGPIVGPAIAVVWGWVPALVWVLVGSIFMGAVHDYGSLIVSMRHRGRTIADLSEGVINARVRILFMIVSIIGLWIVLAIFGLVIATIFELYPSSVVPVIVQIPIAVGLGIWLKRGKSMLLGSIVTVVLMYASIFWSASIDWSPSGLIPFAMLTHLSAVGWWTLILMVYVFIASVLPVDVLLQPRDFINSWQLLIAMGLLVAGVLVAHPPIVADAVRLVPNDSGAGNPSPPMMPFLFITIACGAVSGFHCLVSSGCSSRQIRTENDAQYIGYGAMLTEGFLAVLVIIACIAGVGMVAKGGDGHAVWMQYYQQWGGDAGLGAKLTPFVEGSANMIGSLGVSHHIALALMGVFIASFAATTLDSATRLQRYLISELAGGARTSNELKCAGCGYSREGLKGDAPCPECGESRFVNEPRRRGRIRWCLINRFGATTIAVVSALALTLSDAVTITHLDPFLGAPGRGYYGMHLFNDWFIRNDLDQAGLGGLTLWPIFGATNQLLAGLALLVVTVWLVKTKRPAWVSAVPMVFMLAMTGYAIVLLGRGFADSGSYFLLAVSVLMLILEIWIIVEAAALVFGRQKEQPPA